MSNLSKIHLSKYQIEDKKYGLTTDTNREIDLTGEIGTGEKGTEGQGATTSFKGSWNSPQIHCFHGIERQHQGKKVCSMWAPT